MVVASMTVMKASHSRKMRGDFLGEDLSIEFPVPQKNDAFQQGFEGDLSRRHCRSLSAPDKASTSNWDFSPRGSLNQALKESLQNWKWKMMRKGPENRKKRALNDRRAVLENDVAQLRTRLQDERALREGLERALQGESNASNAQAVPSNLAPQTRELITEIALLETEVSHLEQHVLSLYRKVLDQRLLGRSYGSRTQPCSPEAPDPVEASMSPAYQALSLKRGRKLNSLRSIEEQKICASPPQHRRHLSASQGSKRPHSAVSASQGKTRHGSLLSGTFHCIEEETHARVQPHPTTMSLKAIGTPSRHVKISAATAKLQSCTEIPAPEKKTGKPAGIPSPVEEAMSTNKLPEEAREPLHKEPTKLSEELVRCMAAIYCKLADPPLPQLKSPVSPSSSSSSSTSTSSPHEFSNDSWSPRWRTDSGAHDSASLTDPYQVKGTETDDIGPYSSMVEVPWICVDKDRLTYAARALRNFRSMVEQLEKVDPGQMLFDEKLAFWINVYNALMMHAYLAYGIPGNRIKRLSLLQKAAYKVGAHSINAQTIEHSILGCKSNRPAQWLQSLLSPGSKFKAGDERRAYALEAPEPLVCFALCCGGRSDPAIRVYSAKTVRLELEVAKREFLQASLGIRGQNKVLLPRILEWYGREQMINSTTLLEWVSQNLPEKLQSRIRQCVQSKPHKSPSHCLEWIPYNFGFRYIFVKDLARRFPESAQ